MLKVKKITEKIEIQDLEVQSNPCQYFWDDYGLKGRYDCLVDCYGGKNPYASDKY